MSRAARFQTWKARFLLIALTVWASSAASLLIEIEWRKHRGGLWGRHAKNLRRDRDEEFRRHLPVVGAWVQAIREEVPPGHSVGILLDPTPGRQQLLLQCRYLCYPRPVQHYYILAEHYRHNPTELDDSVWVLDASREREVAMRDQIFREIRRGRDFELLRCTMKPGEDR